MSGLQRRDFRLLYVESVDVFATNRYVFEGGECWGDWVLMNAAAATAKNPTNIGLAIAAGIFVSAGVILLYVINLNYAQRVLRGYHPVFGNKKSVFIAFVVYYLSVVVVLVIGKGFPRRFSG